MGIALIIIVVLIVLLVVILIAMYNGLVKLRNKVENAWAQIDVQLKRRYDLIPNLVETVKGYAAHERETLEAVIAARNSAMTAGTPQEQAQAENVLSGTLKSLFALSEAYPDLKANQNFLNLQEELTSSEDRIAYARQFYNDTVNRYNTKIQTFPSVVLAGAFNFKQREYFEAEGEATGPVHVQF
ncbi:MAG: LemA family protein [Acidimicrobiia bacterium]|nr:LemA family protein [Acidimicrobiia bacterium]